MGLLSHQMLQIVKGVGPIPDDTLSAEQPLITIDLLDSGSGISLDLQDGWEPNIPSLKNGGVWADSPISDGRALIAGVNSNVTETMRLIVSTQNWQVYASIFTALQQIIQDARAFWDTFYQIEPVYLAWWAAGAPGPQYALIYNIDMDVQLEDSEDADATITLTIEREFGWRGVHPGGNPKEWTYYKRGELFNSSVASLVSGSDHLLIATTQNRREWVGAGTNPTILQSQNYFDIPASLIPGDLDALCCLSVTTTISTDIMYFARISKPDLPFSGVIRKPAYILNAGDANLAGADVTFAADTGAPISTSGGTNQRGVVSFATVTTDAFRFTWTGLNRSQFDFNSMRGRFAVFVRARLSAASTVTMHLQADVLGTGVSIVYPTQTLTDIGLGGVGNTTRWSVVYMGVMSFPLGDERILVQDNGLGIHDSVDGNYQLSLYAARPGAAVSLYVADLIFLPIDEVAGGDDIGASGGGHVIDNTGYYLHGKPDDSAHFSPRPGTIKLTGRGLTLKPGVQNRIILFQTDGGNPVRSEITSTLTSRLNIVPCWSGIRDA